MPSPERGKVCVAQVGAPHGVAGEVRLWVFTEDPGALAGYGPLETEDGARRFELEALRPSRDHLVARIAGIADRDTAERLRNLKLYVPRSRLPETGDDEFYHADLIGLAVEDGTGHPLGRVVAVPNFGAGDLLEIQIDNAATTVLMPFTRAVVPLVDVAGGRVVVEPPDGLLPAPGTGLPAVEG